jgi:DinB superfamily
MKTRLKEIILRVTPQLEVLTNEDVSFKPNLSVWSAKEILGHLIDSAMHNHERFVGIGTDEKLEFPGDSQDSWVSFQRWQERDWLEIVGLWKFYSLHLAWLIVRLPDTALERQATVFLSRRIVTLEWLVVHYVEHLEHHLKQIDERVRGIS